MSPRLGAWLWEAKSGELRVLLPLQMVNEFSWLELDCGVRPRCCVFLFCLTLECHCFITFDVCSSSAALLKVEPIYTRVEIKAKIQRISSVKFQVSYTCMSNDSSYKSNVSDSKCTHSATITNACLCHESVERKRDVAARHLNHHPGNMFKLT